MRNVASRRSKGGGPPTARKLPNGRRRYTEEQILVALNEVEAGAKPSEVCTKHGISMVTLARWHLRHGGSRASDARRLKELEEENRRLKSLVADLTLSNQTLKQAVAKKW